MHPLGFDCASSSRLMTAILLRRPLRSREITAAGFPLRLLAGRPLEIFFPTHLRTCALHFHGSDQLFSQVKIKRFYGEEGRVAGSCSGGLKDRSDLSPEGVHLRWVTGTGRDFVVWLESQQSPGSGRLQGEQIISSVDNKLKIYQVLRALLLLFFFRGNCSWSFFYKVFIHSLATSGTNCSICACRRRGDHVLMFKVILRIGNLTWGSDWTCWTSLFVVRWASALLGILTLNHL